MNAAPPMQAKWHIEGNVHTLVVHGFPLKGGNQMLRLQHILEGKAYRDNIGLLVCTPGRPQLTGRAKVECYRTYRTIPLDEDNCAAVLETLAERRGSELYDQIASDNKGLRGPLCGHVLLSADGCLSTLCLSRRAACDALLSLTSPPAAKEPK